MWLPTLVDRDQSVGLGVAAMNLDAARAVWTAARDEHRSAEAQP